MKCYRCLKSILITYRTASLGESPGNWCCRKCLTKEEKQTLNLETVKISKILSGEIK